MKFQRASHNQLASRLLSIVFSLLLCWQVPVATPKLANAAVAEAPAAIKTVRAVKARAHEAYGKLPLRFEANCGQFEEQVKFVSRGGGVSLALTATEARMGTIGMRMLGANPNARISGESELPGKTNYFLGNDPAGWTTDVPAFARVRYEAVYPGIDAVFYGNARQFEYDFIVAPGANPNAIRLSFDGVRQLRLEPNGDLILKTRDGEMRHRKPVAYQQVNGQHRGVSVGYELTRNQVRFVVGDYDADKPLVIDPVLGYSTYLGGGDADTGYAITVDAAGNAYVTGITVMSTNMATPFPATAGAMRPSGNFAQSYYVFVTKLNPEGTGLVYSAIIGGTQGVSSGSQTLAHNESRGIVVDADGNAYVAGFTYTRNFPTTPGVVQSQPLASRDKFDGFVFKLNPNGTALVYSTLFGQGDAQIQGLAVDGQGQAWLTGSTQSRTFPVTTNAFQSVKKNNGVTAFTAKLNATGTQLLYSTYLSSGSGESGLDVGVDAAGNAYVGGTTGSSCLRAGDTPVEPFPTTEGAFRRDLGEGCPSTGSYQYVFAAKFKPDGAIVYSTLLGVSSGGSIAADAQGNAYVTGETFKRYNFPVTPGAAQTEIIGGSSVGAAFVTKLNPQGSALVYSTFLNGARGNGIGSTQLTIDADGNAYVTGAGVTATFTRTMNEPPFNAQFGSFIVKLNSAGNAIPYAVVLGESVSTAIAVDARANVYLCGNTNSDSFPTTPGAFQRQRVSQDTTPDAFVLKVSEAALPTVANVSAANFTGATLSPDGIVAAFGSDLATTTLVATTNPLPTSLAGTSVKITDSAGVARAAQLFFVSPTQVNYLMPSAAANGAAKVVITNGSGLVSTASVQIERVSPGLFTADASGRGLVAAVVLRIKASGERSYEPIARYDAAQGRMMPTPVDLGVEGEQVFLLLYGTGLRHNTGLANAKTKIGGADAQVIYAGAQGDFFGLDQVNALIPRSLIGRGEADIVLSVDGKTANTVKVWIK